MDVGTVKVVDIDDTMRSAYLSYAMSVITSRALPDVRDGLKPVQRRILYAMHDMGIRHASPTKKSARIIGEVLGKYHPHGNAAVYDAMVRMAQSFSMRYPLVEGQGNFGSVDGDGAAAMRYTEARLTAIGEEMLADIEKAAVDFGNNFDGSLKEPTVLPTKLPNLLINGVAGIAVGMATNIPPHNLGEIADAVVYLIKHYDKIDDITVDDLMRFVKGPDFPTGGTILGTEGIKQAFATGKGRIIVRSQAHVENLRGGHAAIIITELPFQVNKANLVERIAMLVREERLQGIADLRDESDRTGMRVVVELKRSVEPGPVINTLLKYTQFQTTFGVNMLALVGGEPRLLSLKQVLRHYVEHRHDVIVRRTKYELDRALARAHILEGLLKALDHLDEVISTIRRSRTADTAKRNLIKRFQFSEKQAQAILDMQLRRLAALERRKIEEEYKEIQGRIDYLKGLLVSKAKILALISQDVVELKKVYGDARRTRIMQVDDISACDPEDLMPDEELYVLFTRQGWVRRRPADVATRASGIPGMSSHERDVLQGVLVARSQDTVLFFTDNGRAFGLPANQIPDGDQQDRGLPFSQLARLSDGERVVAALRVEGFSDERYLCLATRQGKVKRLALKELAGLNRGPIEVVGLAKGDSLGWVLEGNGGELVLVTSQGKAIRLAQDTVRAQGRSAGGVRGITLKDGDSVIGMDQVSDDGQLLVAAAAGYAKRTSLREYTAQGRGGQGTLTIDPVKMHGTGPLTAACVVRETDEVVFTTAAGKMVRVNVGDVPKLRRASWGRVVTRTRRNVVVAVENDQIDGVVKLVSPGGKPSEPTLATSRTSGRASTQRRSGTTARTEKTTSATRNKASGAPRAKKPTPTTRAAPRATRAPKAEADGATRQVSGHGPTAKSSDTDAEPSKDIPSSPSTSGSQRTRRSRTIKTPRRTHKSGA